MRAQVTRSAEWGNWGITFVSWMGPTRPYLVRIHGCRYFPIGNRGPCDGTLGSSERQRYQEMIRAWVQDAILPEGLNVEHATKAPHFRAIPSRLDL